MNKTLTIAISTVANNFDKFINEFNFNYLAGADEVLVICQGDISIKFPAKLDKKIKFIKDVFYGLSRSRNTAILHSTSDYIWFLDDDIILDKESVLKVNASISKQSLEAFTVRMFTGENHQPYKKYPKSGYLNKLNIISISSVEIVVSRKFLLKFNISFNINLGLGTNYPSCEENIFLLDVLGSGGKIYHLPLFTHSHPFVDRSKDFTNPEILLAKGVFCKRFGGFLGCLLMVLWLGRSFYNCRNLNISTKLINGYLNSNTVLSSYE